MGSTTSPKIQPPFPTPDTSKKSVPEASARKDARNIEGQHDTATEHIGNLDTETVSAGIRRDEAHAVALGSETPRSSTYSAVETSDFLQSQLRKGMGRPGSICGAKGKTIVKPRRFVGARRASLLAGTCMFIDESGGQCRTRTCDLLLVRQAL